MCPLFCPPPLGRVLYPLLPTLLAPRALSVRLDIYNTYSTPHRLVIKGRALERKSTDVPLTIADSWWTNLKRTWHALESDEIADLDLLITCEGIETAVTTDNEGLFRIEIKPKFPLAPGCYPVFVRLRPPSFHQSSPAEGYVFVHPVNEISWGVVSDIDDTILETHVTHKKNMLKKLLFDNGLTARPIPGMAAVYQSLAQQGFGFHYLSGSPINLHQRLRAFLKHQAFPEGSMDLRHWGLGPDTDAILSSSTYKLQRLQKLFQCFPHRQFLLIGDSGEKDSEIYTTLQQAFPRQVLGIAIHWVGTVTPPKQEDIFYFQKATELAAFIKTLNIPQKHLA